MNNIKVNSGIIDRYQPSPDRFYNIKGKILEKDGKDIKIESELAGTIYNVNLKNELTAKVGQVVEIEKENINKIKKESEEDKSYVLNKTYEENREEVIELLLKLGIKPTKENIELYSDSRQNLVNIIKNLDTETIIKISEMDLDIGEMPLGEVSDLVDFVRSQEERRPIFNFCHKKMDYKEAEKVSMKLYNQKMGKDVYDAIIALSDRDLDLSRENIESIVELLHKVKDIETIENPHLIQALETELDFNIDNLFKLKNNYIKSSIGVNKKSEELLKSSVVGRADFKKLERLLTSLDIDLNDENMEVARQLILANVDISKESVERVGEMKKTIKTVSKSLDSQEIIRLEESGMDILNTDLELVLEAIESKDLGESYFKRDLNTEELVDFIKEDRDFNIKNIASITETREPEKPEEREFIRRVEDIKSAFDHIDNHMSLDYMKEVKKLETVSLESMVEVKAKSDIPVDRSDLVLREYLKFKNNLSLKDVRDSLRDRVDLMKGQLSELNSYMDNRVNRYKELMDLRLNLGEYESIIPEVIRNNLDMNLSQLRDIDLYYSGSLNISSLVRESGDEELEDSLENIFSPDLREMKENYISFLGDFSSKDFKDDSLNKKRDRLVETSKKLNKNSISFSIPVDLGHGYSDLNIIYPSRDIDLKNMAFKLRLKSKNLGDIDMDLAIRSRDVYVATDNEKVLDHMDIFREKLSYKSYNLRTGDGLE